MLPSTPNELRAHLHDALAARDKALGRNPNHKSTKTAHFEWLQGVYHALSATEHPLHTVVGAWVFLAAVHSVKQVLAS
jgi:hypothetical protein